MVCGRLQLYGVSTRVCISSVSPSGQRPRVIIQSRGCTPEAVSLGASRGFLYAALLVSFDSFAVLVFSRFFSMSVSRHSQLPSVGDVL